jgi:hypothetical protein
MPTVTLTLLLIVVGFGISFEIARRKGGIVRYILAYLAGFVGVLLAMSVATLFSNIPFGEEAIFAPWAALFAPAVGVLLGRRKLRPRQGEKSE